jgi:cyclic-di-AMP phosphodiesterase PgpH
MMQKKPPIGQDEESHLRERYTAHTHKFLDWASRHGLERTFLGRVLAVIEYKLNVRKFSYILFFSLLLAYLLNFEIRTPTYYQVGDTARTDIKSPMTFEMIDEVTTEEKRIRGEMAVPIICDFDPSVFERVSGAVYRSFRLMRAEIKNIKWPRSVNEREEKIKEFFSHKSEFEKELGVQVPYYIFEWLTSQYFAARY